MNKTFFESVACALPHKCPKEMKSDIKCAHCEIGYNFIACQPKTLQCGHLVCDECTEKIKHVGFKCQFCSEEMTNSNSPCNSSGYLIDCSLKQLTERLSETYKSALNMFTGNFCFIFFNIIKNNLFLFFK